MALGDENHVNRPRLGARCSNPLDYLVLFVGLEVVGGRRVVTDSGQTASGHYHSRQTPLRPNWPI